MKTKNKQKNKWMTRLILSMALAVQGPLAAYAEDGVLLKPATPVVDTDPVAPSDNFLAQPATLIGSIHKSGMAEANAAPSGAPLQGNASDVSSGPNFKQEGPSLDDASPYMLAVKKLAAKAKLTADEFRALGVGVVGCDSSQGYMKKNSRIIRVYPGCPAEQAGMKVGDIVLGKRLNTARSATTLYDFTCGIAGDTVNYTIERDGKILDFHIVEMNMEDVPDAKIRHQIEGWVRETGWPADHVPIKPPVTAGSVLRGLLGL